MVLIPTSWPYTSFMIVEKRFQIVSAMTGCSEISIADAIPTSDQ